MGRAYFVCGTAAKKIVPYGAGSSQLQHQHYHCLIKHSIIILYIYTAAENY